MRDRDWGFAWRLGSKEGPRLVSHHTPISKKKFGTPKNKI
jgi:hypothetical protein